MYVFGGGGSGERVIYSIFCVMFTNKIIFYTCYFCADSHEKILLLLHLSYYVILKALKNMVNVNEK